MNEITRTPLAPGVRLTCITTQKFKTSAMGVSLLLPLRGEPVFAALPHVLRRGTAQYPSLDAIGGALENAIRRAQVRDMTRALMLDCCGSVAVEAVCDNAVEEIKSSLGAPFLTDRFSPGYGDLPLSVQPRFLDTLDAARRIGLHLTPTGIMTPRKSVTAILGIANTPQPRRCRGCAYCSMFETCTFRKAGKTCGKS